MLKHVPSRITSASRLFVAISLGVLVSTSGASAAYFAVDYRPIPASSIADAAALSIVEANLRADVDGVPNMVVLPLPYKVPPDFIVSSLLAPTPSGLSLTLIVTKMPEGTTKTTEIKASTPTDLTAKLSVTNFITTTLVPLFSRDPAVLDVTSLVIPLHPIDDKLPNITNRLVAALAKRGIRAKPKLDFDFRGVNQAGIRKLCDDEAVTSIFGWDVEQERLSNPLGIYTYRADVALHQFGCQTAADTKSALGTAKRKLWLNPVGGVSALVALATLGGANPGISPLSTFVSSTTSAAFPSNSDDDFRNFVIQSAIENAVDNLKAH